EAPRRRSFRDARRVRRLQTNGVRQGFPDGGVVAADAFVLPRGRRLRTAQGGARGEGDGAGLMPKHAERRHLPYRADQLFDLVADVERYPEFLPWCTGARIRERTDNVIVADLLIGFRMVRERFTSRVTLNRPDRIDVAYSEGPFRYLENHWKFEPLSDGSCVIDFYVAFEFR